jgi:hypothetical protein
VATTCTSRCLLGSDGTRRSLPTRGRRTRFVCVDCAQVVDAVRRLKWLLRIWWRFVSSLTSTGQPPHRRKRSGRVCQPGALFARVQVLDAASATATVGPSRAELRSRVLDAPRRPSIGRFGPMPRVGVVAVLRRRQPFRAAKRVRRETRVEANRSPPFFRADGQPPMPFYAPGVYVDRPSIVQRIRPPGPPKDAQGGTRGRGALCVCALRLRPRSPRS